MKSAASLLLLAALSCASAPPEPVRPRPWPHEGSDLPLDPRVHVGALANGLRFAWVDCEDPKDRCQIVLHVNVGSFHEEPDEYGMAHVVEHMAFNGTRRFPRGALVPWLQHHGMALGPDAIATTGTLETVFRLRLASADVAEVIEGLSVIREFADGLTFPEDSVAIEKDIVDAEERERGNPGQRVELRMQAVAFAGTRVAHSPIGTKPIRDGFTAPRLRRFWERWYRPDRMTLLVVGDLRDIDAEALVRRAFDDVRAAAAPPPTEPNLEDPPPDGRFACVHDAELPVCGIQVTRVFPFESAPPKATGLGVELGLDCARAIVNARLEALVKAPGSPFLRAAMLPADADDRTGMGLPRRETLAIACLPNRWREAVEASSRELHRALDVGFEQAEFSEAMANVRQHGVNRSDERSAEVWVRELLAFARGDSIPLARKERLDRLWALTYAMTAEECRSLFALRWRHGDLAIRWMGPGDSSLAAPAELAPAFDAGKAGLASRSRGEVAPIRYAPTESVAVNVRTRSTRSEGVEEIEFENGVVLRVRRTDFVPRDARVRVRFGSGGLSLDPPNYTLTLLAQQAFSSMGLRDHSESELRRATAGKSIATRFSVGDDHFQLDGDTTPSDLDLQCEILAAHVSHPGWREDGWDSVRQECLIAFDVSWREAFGATGREFWPRVYAGSVNWIPPTRDELARVKPEDVRRWLEPHLAEDAITVSIVGDVSIGAAIAAVARTFGSLPRRTVLDVPDSRRRESEPAHSGVHARAEIDTSEARAQVTGVYPCEDRMDPAHSTRKALLRGLLHDRLFRRIRQEHGDAYSPTATEKRSSVFPREGWLGFSVMAAPEEADAVLESCVDVADELAREGPTADEIDRTKKVVLAHWRTGLRKNEAWIDALADFHCDPNAFDRWLHVDRFVTEARPEDLRALAAEVFPRDRASTLIVRPRAR
ncbi:MAG TPA: insulinase family protein [Planctomycetota bacterium]|nr:insulinase family protein [Planctomycetota bacterium]